jgi:hypothetical protein
MAIALRGIWVLKKIDTIKYTGCNNPLFFIPNFMPHHHATTSIFFLQLAINNFHRFLKNRKIRYFSPEVRNAKEVG